MIPARRFVSFAILLFFAVPFGLSVSGCKHALAIVYCNGGDAGPEVGQVATITLSPSLATYGESLNYGQIGQSLSATAQDCKGNAVSVTKYTFASTNGYTSGDSADVFADINPSTGQVCAGTWNRNTGGGIADYTTCTPPPTTPSGYLAYVTATANGASSNAIPVYVHPVPTSIPIGAPSGSCLVGTEVFSQTVAATTTQGAIAVTVSSTTGLAAGEPISGPGIPANATIAAITSATTLNLSNAATATTITFAGATTSGSPTVTLTAPVTTAGLSIGEGVTGPGIPASTTISAINPSASATTSTVTLSNNATATATTVTLATNVALTVTITGSTTQLSNQVTLSTTAGLAAGEGISGTGIPATTSIVAVTPTTVTISNPATATASNIPLTIIGNPTSNCCPLVFTAPGNPPPYQPNSSCLSQGQSAQLVASVYSNNSTYAGNNITCQVGHLTFSPIGATNVATIDQNGVITANQPGSATITAAITSSGSGSTTGFFSTCPPASIVLSATGQPAPTPGTDQNINVNLNVPQSFSTQVLDTNGNPITGISLEFESTNPQTLPAGSNTVTPVFPGSGTITAVCQPGTCNPAPFSQINYQGNGVALTSNGITVNTAGSSSTVIYIGSTASQYLYPVDFTTNQPATLLKLPYVPNSMVINEAGSDIYLGSSQGLMTVSTANNALSSTNTTVVGSVISVSPDGSTLIVTDPARQTISLVSSTGSVDTTYGGVATHASWSPDSQTVYITAGNQFLIHSAYTNWTALPVTTTLAYTDVTVTVPHIGAYFAGVTEIDGRSYCPVTTLTAGSPPVAVNSFYPVAETVAKPADRIAATTDGNHILGATATAPAALQDLNVTPPALPVTTECPQANLTTPSPAVKFTSSNTTYPLTGVVPTAITGVIPSTNSAVAFVTYTGTGATGTQLPMYVPSTGTLSYVSLPGATAAVSGVFSTDNLTFYTGTAGDNIVHEVSVTYPATGNPTAAQSGTITPSLPCGVGNIAAPNLTCAAGSIVTPNLIVQRPKKSTN